MREAQEEMERGTDVLGDELNVLWQNVREEAADDSDGDNGGGGGGGGSGGGCSKTQRLPRREADALLDGLEALQVEMEGEASSFQRRKTELMRKLETLPTGGGGAGGAKEVGRSRRKEREADRAAVGLEEEAESMRTAVIASHARLLGRVREVWCQGMGEPHRIYNAAGAAADVVPSLLLRDDDETGCCNPALGYSAFPSLGVVID